MKYKSTALAVLAFGLAMGVRAQTLIPTTYALPSNAGDTTKPGFIWRISEVTTAEPNSLDFLEAQLAGLEGDNLADPTVVGIADGPAAPPSPSTAPIEFTISTTINLDKAAGSHGSFQPDDQMPGLPGTGGSTDNAAAEALTYLNFPAGTITMGVNSDDGFRVLIGGANPKDKFGVDVGEFNGGRGASDTVFSFTIQKAGIYSARLIWENGGGDANVEWWTVKSDGTTRVLVGDTANGGIPAYRAVTGSTPAYASALSPIPGGTGVAPNAPIQIQLTDGSSPLDSSKISLSLDGAKVAAAISKSGAITSINYTNAGIFLPLSVHTNTLSFVDGSNPVTLNWSFTVAYYATLTSDETVTADKSKPGFNWNIFANDADQQNNNDVIDLALNGLLVDSTGAAIPNIADPNAQGAALAAGTASAVPNGPIHFEIGTVINLDLPGSSDGNFANDAVLPGLPETDGTTDGDKVEITTYLDLPAGVTTLGVTSDDGFRATAGSVDILKAKMLGEFNGGRGAADTIFYVVAQQAGVYPVRVLWENGGGGANIEFWSLKADKTKVLVNDTANGGIPAYRAVTSPVAPYVKFVAPRAVPRQVNIPSSVVTIILQDGTTAVADASVALTVDGAPATTTSARNGGTLQVTWTPSILETPAESHAASLAYKDSGGASLSDQWSFMNLKAVILPTPAITEDFESYAQGQDFSGPETASSWYTWNYTTEATAGLDLTNPNSDSYLNWVVVDFDTFVNIESGISNIRPGETLNGQPITTLASGNIFAAESDNRPGSQVQFAISKAFDLSKITNAVISFASLYRQNQDSLGAVEYSVDGGTNWLPVIYYMDGASPADIVIAPDGSSDAVATFNAVNADTAYWTVNGVNKGGNYGDGIAAPITQALSPYIAPRINDDNTEGKRLEVVRLPQAGLKKDVRIRLSQLGTCSWYFCIDNISFYDVALPAGSGGPAPKITSITSAGGQVTVTWINGGTLQKASSLVNPTWTSTGNSTGTFTETPTGNTFYRVSK